MDGDVPSNQRYFRRPFESPNGVVNHHCSTPPPRLTSLPWPHILQTALKVQRGTEKTGWGMIAYHNLTSTNLTEPIIYWLGSGMGRLG